MVNFNGVSPYLSLITDLVRLIEGSYISQSPKINDRSMLSNMELACGPYKMLFYSKY